ncbi:phage tail assembly chaperone [Pseudomonas sichuanensis]|uniref:phage tail assembly chaperone n=1 Tax=Pseudomonas sichuanensis TaxID=2213015 RepID=UPI002160E3A5|nr:phage tail assembly chaperone [Pseudomonas sichuanensis]UVK80698.1 phage tail assembly chaperone [Pseudomonas sichuanensis]
MNKALIQDGVVVGFASGDSLGQAIPEGLLVGFGWRFEGGQFIESATTPDPAQVEAAERAWRDTELAALVWLRDRHRDQLEIGAATTLTPEQFGELLAFMQALRDWPQSAAFPDSSARPVPPAFLDSMRAEQ